MNSRVTEDVGLAKKRQQDAVLRHDVFNLITLALINFLNFWYLLYGSGFQAFWWASMTYFVVDFVWIAADPACVKSPIVLYVHHVVAALYALLPFYYPAVEEKMCYVMTVEVNTWLLIARRVFRLSILNALFHFTWVLIRNIWFPFLVYDTTAKYLEYARAEQNIWHPILLAPAMQLGLCVLNAQWTLQLYSKKRSRKEAPHQL